VRVLVVGIVCMAVGFGAGWAVFERPWKGDDEPQTFTVESIERVSGKALAPRARHVTCDTVQGPFYSCRVLTAVNRGADYEVTVARNERCLLATRDDPSTEEDLLDNLQPDAFERDPALPPEFRAWLTDRSDC